MTVQEWVGLLIPALFVLVLIVLAYRKDGSAGVGDGFKETGSLFLKILPNLVIGFTLAGFLMLLLPKNLVAQWIGPGSGTRGLMVGSLAGMLTPGGPFTHFPILAALLKQGAAIGPVAAYIAAWALLGVHRIIIWESPILGWKFTGIRVAACLVFPPIIGLLAEGISKVVER
ncbi:MAG: permease [Planctomycetota bacterium]